MTEQDISRLMARLHEEDDMLMRDHELRFDGSVAWEEFTTRMAHQVSLMSFKTPDRKGTAGGTEDRSGGGSADEKG